MYQIPTPEEIRPALANKKFYSLLDLKHGFYHCKLDEISSNICTFSSPFGSYKLKRLPFGLSVAPEIFQKLKVKYFGEIASKSEHDLILEKVTENARKLNVKFNIKKFQYCVSEFKFLGFIFNEFGVTPDPDRIRVIQELNETKNKKELQSFLGMINYLRLFLQNLSKIVTPFRELLKKNGLWNWNKQCQLTFIKLKEFICKIPTLKNFDSKLMRMVSSNIIGS